MLHPVLPVADPWFAVHAEGDGIVSLTEPHVARLWRANVFLVRGRDRDLLVDTGMGVGDLRAALQSLSDRLPIVFTTHSHLDHIGGHTQFPDAEILVHPAERDSLRRPEGPVGLDYASLPAARRHAYRQAGFVADGLMIDAAPCAGYHPVAHRFAGSTATGTVEEGDVIDLGGRRFDVLHLPGHSPGSVALWEAESGILIAGDAIYDGILIDSTADADIAAYIATMERLRRLPVRIVHGGHKRPFGRDRMIAIIDAYLESRRHGATPAGEPAVSF
jgi:glyoxylase-like metal-dependent hydrolase (beta-lactamase superfamily II)